jgi:hypothetical protein
MNQLVPFHSSTLPALVATAGERASMRFLALKGTAAQCRFSVDVFVSRPCAG